MKWAIFYEDSKVPPMENFTDGAHIFVFSTSVGYSQRIIPLEDEGWEVRDCIKIFNGKEDRQVALLRKPFKGTIASNVLKHGCGGLNIDACRIQYETSGSIASNPMLRQSKGHSHKQSKDDNSSNFKIKKTEGNFEPVKGGRWPANLILTHTADCEYLGLKEVKGDGHAPKLSKGNPFGGVNEQPHDEHYFKHEIVGNYLCSPNCPVSLIDRQSGYSKSSSSVRKNRKRNAENIYGGGKGIPEMDLDSPHSDSGGASRFFFNAETRNQVVAYLRRMINPT